MFVVVIPNVATGGFSVKLLEASDETESVSAARFRFFTWMHNLFCAKMLLEVYFG